MDTKHSDLYMYGLHFIQDILTVLHISIELARSPFQNEYQTYKITNLFDTKACHIYIYIYSNQICQVLIVGWIAFVLQHVTFKTLPRRPSPTANSEGYTITNSGKKTQKATSICAEQSTKLHHSY